ncbi:TonB-dependent receptor plug domain-containing protein [Hymenobacter sp. 5317J-9]|uniref:TonB-dependent receptor plug domain-containing protein n=1 Tax=Hymenobacter sp. 5317J-9 TaxID=2932250 RepID=UPI001FD6EDB0|nr:TonB-dependent receptor plug domain-containing protein [Hymenobacter sp. 5317J-9]UOQ98469.1 TonB-dependent receptor plug domain-containing protein [Hymenobacter sp. 5317J-9]
MSRILPAALLVFSITAAQAQQIDTLTARRVAVRGTMSDSIIPQLVQTFSHRTIYCPVQIIVNHWTPPSFLTIQPILTQVPGVQVTPTSGAPGAWATVRIRGGSSLADTDQPLYLVDGLPALNADFAPGAAISEGVAFGAGPEAARVGANPLLFVPTEDVESITVLQGAVATAQYGAQGSNGVIAITTKRGGKSGQKQPLRVRYAGFGGVQQVRQRYSLLNARQYADLANEAETTARPGFGVPFPSPDLERLGAGTDWQAELFRTAFLQNHHLAFDGSSARTRYALSADYLNQAGVVQHSNLTRYALRLNLDQQLSSQLRVSLNAAAAHIAHTLPGQGAVAAALLAPPTLPARQADGRYYQTNSYYPYSFPGTFFNPLAIANDAGYEGTTRRLLLQAGLHYQLQPNFRVSLSASHEGAGTDGTDRTLFALFGGGPPPAPDNVRNTTLTTAATVAQLQLAYDHHFTEDQLLALEATAGSQSYRLEQTTQQLAPGSSYSNSATTNYTLYNAALVARYSYRERYEALASLRADVNQATFYRNAPTTTSWLPGAELRWHLHHENFLSGSQFLQTLTLWAAAGQTSNTGLVSSGLGSGVQAGQVVVGGSVGPPVPVAALPYPASALPRTTQLEAGLRVGLWQNHVLLDVDAYRRTTAHVAVPQLVPTPLPTGVGYVFQQRDADLRTQGLQLSASSTWAIGKLKGNSRVAAALLQQRVLAVADGPLGGGAAVAVAGLVVGEAPHPYLLYERLGVAASGQPAAGQVRYQDLDGNGRLNEADARYQGTVLPTRQFTLTQTLTLGRFTLDVQADALGGHQLLNTTLARLELPTGATNGTTRLLDRWTPTANNPDIPQASASSSIVLARYDSGTPQSAANLRLSQLTLSYDLRPTSPHPMSVWVGGQNLFVLTRYRGFDPNVSSGGATLLAAGYDTNAYPVPRTWLLGVRASF